MPRGLVMDADLDTLALALYVKIDELVTLAVMQALLSYTSDAR
jgi:hypothetical protein